MLIFYFSFYLGDFSSKYNSNLQKSKLEVYLEEQRSSGTENFFEVLQFWRKNGARFPILSSMACDIFCISISTVASESAFSCSGHIINRFRSSIKFENAKALLCLRDWLFGEKYNFFYTLLFMNGNILCFIAYEFVIFCSSTLSILFITDLEEAIEDFQEEVVDVLSVKIPVNILLMRDFNSTN